MRVRAVVLFATLAAGCASGSPTAPSPSPVSNPPPPQTPANVTGRVIATNGKQAIAGVQVQAMGQTVTTNSEGRFTLSLSPGTDTYSVMVYGISVETLHATISASVSSPTLEAIALGGAYDSTFYQRFVFDGGARPLRRWSAPPRIYLRTVDNAGAAIDAHTLDSTAAAIINTTGLFTGGQFGISALEKGTGTRRGQTGWITVEWAPQPNALACGEAPTVGDYMLLYYKNFAGCACGNSAIRPLTVKHELGHAMGFYHTNDARDLMSGLAVTGCDMNPSAREMYHAAIAYSRPLDTTAPDSWPSTAVIRNGARLWTEPGRN